MLSQCILVKVVTFIMRWKDSSDGVILISVLVFFVSFILWHADVIANRMMYYESQFYLDKIRNSLEIEEIVLNHFRESEDSLFIYIHKSWVTASKDEDKLYLFVDGAISIDNVYDIIDDGSYKLN